MGMETHRITGAVLALVSSSVFAADPPPTQIQSETFELAATKAEIMSRAKTCVAKLVRYDGVRVDTRSAIGIIAGSQSEPDANTDVPGGSVIVDANLENGALIANNRLSAKFIFNSTFYIDSTLTIDIRDGKFRITHTNIKTNTKDPLGKMRGLTKPATEALINENRSLASCITATPDDF
jgi:hypothetical protein